ncbi:hypothetical protein [Nocardioides sp. T2.26MG-1]|uniref:hypothetical protein n=1 Tax=Nocardioides sp. T2.26MG-1 TaxID=3041166 RepID=UPI002477846A|nr:hypothetical protein [Nocardioides sp. T2.26MG-1]CAI9403818.1 hypothetical protein HIDPHFAB_04057 [Nocardioides sp. T2.26MG-1]
MRHRALLAAALGALLTALVLGAVGAPPTAAADPPGDVTGRVLGPGGGPLGGVVVRMTAYGERDAAAATTTANDGTFSLPGSARPARFVLVVCGSDAACDDVWQATEIVKTYVGPDEQAFTLPALHGYFTTDVSGGTASPAVDVGDVHVVRPATLTVVDDTGHWVPPFSGPGVSGLWPEIHQDVTVFPVLAPGTHQVTLDWLHLPVTVTAGESATLRFGPRPLLTGRIMVGGRPVRGEHVAVATSTVHRYHNTATTRTGRYRTGPLPIDRQLTVRLGAQSDGSLDRGSGPKRVYHLTLQPGEVRNLSVAVRAGSLGALAVTADLGDFSAVGLRRVSGPGLGKLIVHDGRARTGGLAPGRYALTASWRTQNLPDAQDWRADRAIVRVRAGHTARVHLAPPTGPGELTLHAEPGSYVRLDSASPDATFSTREVPTSGDVVVSGLPAGEYDVTVARNQYATPSDPVRVRVGRAPVEATLPPPPALGSARVRLVDPDTGQPWLWTAGVITAISCHGQLPLEDGVFVGELEPGTYRDCVTWELWNDPGVPTGTGGWGQHAIDGTLVVRPGEQTTTDLAVDLTP